MHISAPTEAIVPAIMVTRLPLRVASGRSDSPKAIRGMASTVPSCWSSALPLSTPRTPLYAPQVLCLPPPRPILQPPLLLLRGDELHVSPQGVAKSCYHLADDTAASLSLQETLASRWTIEERYCLTDSVKSFVVRGPASSSSSPSSSMTIMELQEADTRLVGTGGTTWEASMVMALYFTRNAHQLQGDIVELGSGVGLGGMLLHHVLSHHHHHHGDQEPTSMTLTDGNEQVLLQCRKNVQHYLDTTNATTAGSIQVQHLDWCDVWKKKQQQRHTPHQSYHTVIACDCAYRTQDVLALKETLKALLHRDEDQPKHLDRNTDRNSSIHLFGPYNRAAYHELIDIMERDEELQVQIEWMELCRYRLLAAGNTDSPSTNQHDAIQYPFTATQYNHPCRPRGYDYLWEDELKHSQSVWEDELKQASKSATKFLHVVATLRRCDTGIHNCNQHSNSSLSEID
jgi:hypothetical protein